MVLLLIFSVQTCLFATGASAEEMALPVRAVEIEGNRKIDTQSLKAKIKTKPGDILSMTAIREDIRQLYAVGYFDDVRADIDPFEGGVKIIFVLTEKPTLAKVEYVGNDEISEDQIRKDIPLSPGSMADFRVINDNMEKLRALYENEGFAGATIVPILKTISKDSATLTVQIDEGEKIRVDKIQISGNVALRDKEIRDAMETKESSLFSFITGSGKYVRAQIRADLDRIVNLYHTRGYITAHVSEPTLTYTDDREKLVIGLVISEGEQFKIGTVNISGIEKGQRAEVEKRFHLKSGETFNRDTLRADILSITDYYADLGYAFADVVPDLNIKEKDRIVDLEVHIAENKIVKVDRIRILGNTTTRDKVIRREVRMDEGEIYHPQKLKRSYNRINNLNYFDTVEVTPEPRPAEGMMDVVIRVKEKPTGSFSIGGGYSSVDGFLAMAELTEGNLFGRGQSVKVKATIGGTREEYLIRFTEPWLMDRPVSLDTTVYKQWQEYVDYSKDSTGFSLILGKQLSEYLRGSVGYSFERANITNVDKDASEFITDQEGSRDTSKISGSLRRDSLDNRMMPREGSINSVYASFAGLGGDNKFYTIEGDSHWYFPLFQECAFSVRGRFGMAGGVFGEDLPLYERFYIGGINTVRGFDYGAAGPRDSQGEYKGGSANLVFNAEYTFPLLSAARLYGVTFYDKGAAFDSTRYIGLRDSAGVGIRWISPMGPLRLEWGKNINPKYDEESSRWDFTFGTFF